MPMAKKDPFILVPVYNGFMSVKGFFIHLKTVNSHRLGVFVNGCKLGIGFQCLFHDLSKYSHAEFSISVKYATGRVSPVYLERKENNLSSLIAIHHVAKNKHHWEYWTDFQKGKIVSRSMPYKYLLEYVADTLSASKTYNKAAFTPSCTLEYFNARSADYYMTRRSREFIRWCLERYAESGFKNLKKRQTKTKYEELCNLYPEVESFDVIGPST